MLILVHIETFDWDQLKLQDSRTTGNFVLELDLMVFNASLPPPRYRNNLHAFEAQFCCQTQILSAQVLFKKLLEVRSMLDNMKVTQLALYLASTELSMGFMLLTPS